MQENERNQQREEQKEEFSIRGISDDRENIMPQKFHIKR